MLTFAHALEIETASLQAAHPILADAIGRAHALLVDGKVFPLEDGHTAEIGSTTDPALSYHVNGHCTCKAHEFGNTACKHRLAYRLYQRVCDRLAAEEERYTVDLAPEALPQSACEVPAIMSMTVTMAGRCVEVKLCDTDDARLVARIEALLQRFPLEEESARMPVPTVPPVCPTHGPLKQSSKAPGTWFCPKKNYDGSYCGERFPGKGGAQ